MSRGRGHGGMTTRPRSGVALGPAGGVPHLQIAERPAELSRLVDEALAVLVNISAVSNSKNEYDELGVVDFVDDSVVARAYSPLTSSTHELDGLRWARIRR